MLKSRKPSRSSPRVNTANSWRNHIPSGELWQGRHVKLADATGLSMPDTEENQARFESNAGAEFYRHRLSQTLQRKTGLSFLEALELPAGLLLRQQLELLRNLQVRIREDEKTLETMLERVRSLPGMGPILAAVVVRAYMQMHVCMDPFDFRSTEKSTFFPEEPTPTPSTLTINLP